MIFIGFSSHSPTLEAVLPVGNNPIGIAINPNGALALVANSNSDTISVIDLTGDISPLS